jgi:hypothetical protein
MTSHRFPVFVQDEKTVRTLAKSVGAHAAQAANLDKNFDPLFRHSAEFLAKGMGSTSFNRLVADAAGRPPEPEPGLCRKHIQDRFAAAIAHGAAVLAQEGKLNPDHARAITLEAPAIARNVADELKQLTIDRSTFEFLVLDPLLIGVGAPPFEVAVLTEGNPVHAFVFDLARQAVLQRAGDMSAEALARIPPDDIRELLRKGYRPLTDVMQARLLPLTHTPVLLTDEGNDVVGVAFQNPIHLGVVPRACCDPDDFWAVAAALYLPGQAQQRANASRSYMGFDDPNSAGPSMYQGMQSGPAVYYTPVTIDVAIDYLVDLDQAVNGARVASREPARTKLHNTYLNWQDVIKVGKGITRRQWGLASARNGQQQAAVMSACGLFADGIFGAQWYLRQHDWLTETDVPELDMPYVHPAPKPTHRFDNGPTKIIPDFIDDFMARAALRVKKLEREPAATGAVQKIKQQAARIAAIRADHAAVKQAQEEAHIARLAYVGPRVRIQGQPAVPARLQR